MDRANGRGAGQRTGTSEAPRTALRLPHLEPGCRKARLACHVHLLFWNAVLTKFWTQDFFPQFFLMIFGTFPINRMFSPTPPGLGVSVCGSVATATLTQNCCGLDVDTTAFLNRKEPIIYDDCLFVAPQIWFWITCYFQFFSPCAVARMSFLTVWRQMKISRGCAVLQTQNQRKHLFQSWKRDCVYHLMAWLCLHVLPLGFGILAGHFSCFHSINSCSGQGKFGACLFQAFKLWPISPFSAMSFGRNLKEVCLPQSVPTA